MHDIKQIRENRDGFVAGLARRAAAFDGKTPDETVASILDLDNRWRAATVAFETHRARQNEASRAIGQAKAKKDEAGAAALLTEVAGLKEAIQKDEAEQRTLEDELKKALSVLPNLPVDDIPDGPDEAFNIEVEARRFGEAPRLNFKPKEHFDLGEALGLMDFERAAKVSGARFVFLKGALAKLERALGAFMLDLQTGTNGYTELNVPVMVRDDAMYGTGQLPKFKEEQFFSTQMGWRTERLNKILEPLDDEIAKRGAKAKVVIDELIEKAETIEQFWLIPTAEVPLTNYVSGEILEEANLPLRFTAWTPCFRAEAGAAGRDTRGMIRQHQFSKVELVSITTPEQSAAEHERMTDCAQEVLKRLGLAHRVVTLSTGDMGFSAQKTYDIEVWLPGQDRFREISSCSNCGDFQARRMNARYRPKEGKNTRFVHTLNGSGLAVGRTLIAVLENYQESDGSIRIPDALQSYMGMTKIEKK